MKLKTYKMPAVGEKRTVRGFAWLPEVVSEKETVWFERYERTETFFKPMNIPGLIIHPVWCIYDPATGRVRIPNYVPNDPENWTWIPADRYLTPPPPPKPMRPVSCSKRLE